MTTNVEIRIGAPGDLAAIESLYPEAFPDEELLPLVRDLLGESNGTLSLVATVDSSLVGHVIFTNCRVADGDGHAALLGPLVVAAAWRGRGIATALVREGLRRLKDGGIRQVFVLGDPAYYGRLDFRPEPMVKPPYELPSEWTGAWQSQSLSETAIPLSGKLLVPRPWLRSELWLP
jgi:putative acetyltransferase